MGTGAWMHNLRGVTHVFWSDAPVAALLIGPIFLRGHFPSLNHGGRRAALQQKIPTESPKQRLQLRNALGQARTAACMILRANHRTPPGTRRTTAASCRQKLRQESWTSTGAQLAISQRLTHRSCRYHDGLYMTHFPATQGETRRQKHHDTHQGAIGLLPLLVGLPCPSRSGQACPSRPGRPCASRPGRPCPSRLRSTKAALNTGGTGPARIAICLIRFGRSQEPLRQDIFTHQSTWAPSARLEWRMWHPQRPPRAQLPRRKRSCWAQPRWAACPPGFEAGTRGSAPQRAPWGL